MVDILRALEKLRKLRKEAAARKGKHDFAFLLLLCPGTSPSPKRLIEKCLILHDFHPLG